MKNAILLFALMFPPAVPALAQSAAATGMAQLPPQVTASFDIYAFGLKLAQVGVNLQANGPSYGFAMALQSAGAAKIFVDARSDVQARGRLCAGGACAVDFRTSSLFNGDTYGRFVRYEGDGRAKLVERVVPKDGWGKERAPVPEAQQVGPDPAGATLALIANARPGATLTARSYDGQQVIAYTMSCKAQMETLPETSRSPFAGDALPCTLRTDIVAGKALGEDAEAEYRERQPVQLWLARQQSIWLPVRFEAKGRRGSATGYVTSWQFGDGEQQAAAAKVRTLAAR